jgi:hypothetical protein
VWAIVNFAMVSQYFPSYISVKSVYFIYGIRYLMLLVHAISVIMKAYTISYGELSYLVNGLGIQFSVLYRQNS